MNLKHKYIIGTHIMFYEIDMAEEHVQSIINAVNRVANPENVTIDLLYNEYRNLFLILHLFKTSTIHSNFNVYMELT